VGVVGVFLGANATNKKKSFTSSACARRRWWPGTSTACHGIYTPWDFAPVPVDGVGLGGLVCGMWGRGLEISRYGPY
jgi:hypothetical protein